MKRKLLPPFLMLLAGAIACIIMFWLHYDTRIMLEILLGVLIVFYLFGCLLKKMLDVFERQNMKALDEGEVIEKEVLEEEEADSENQDETVS